MAELPGGVKPVYLAEAFLKRWGMKTGEDIVDVVTHKLVSKEGLLAEIERMGVGSDVNSLHKDIEAFKGESLLFVWDEDSEYGENFYMCTTEERQTADLERLEPPTSAETAPQDAGIEDAEHKDDVAAAEEEEAIPEYVERPVIPGDWASLGSEEAVQLLEVKPTRPRLGFTISRPRREFGIRVQFNDADPADKIAEYPRQMQPGYDLMRSTLDTAVQAVPPTIDLGTQTRWYRKVNHSTQSAPIRMSAAKTREIMASTKMKRFVTSAFNNLEEALLSNETMQVFRNELSTFDDDDAAAGSSSKHENNLKTFLDFRHEVHSKGRNIPCIKWHPNIPGVVAFSCSQQHGFDQWCDHSGRVSSSTILLWNFKDVLQPEYILTVPGNLQCFAINKDEPTLVVGGLTSGQVVCWDLSGARLAKAPSANDQNLKPTQPTAGQEKKDSGTKKSKDGKDGSQVPTVQPMWLSSVDKSHSRPVTDIHWLPKGYVIKKNGEVQNPDHSYNPMFLSLSGDGCLSFWSTEAPSEQPHRHRDDTDDYKWLPIHVMPLVAPPTDAEPAKRPLAPTKLALGDSTDFVAVTEAGEVAFGDWGPKDEEQPQHTIQMVLPCHDLPCTSVQRCPHFPDVFLTVGDWTFSIWKKGIQRAVFVSPCASSYLTSGVWSPTRPGVVVCARADGNLDVWDLLDQCHREVVSHSTSEGRVESIQFWQPANSSQQFLAAGDTHGRLHVLEMPRVFRRPVSKEKQLVESFYQREIRRSEAATLASPLPSSGAEAEAQQPTEESKDVAVAPTAARGDHTTARSGTGDIDHQQEAEFLKQLEEFCEELQVDHADKIIASNRIAYPAEGFAQEVSEHLKTAQEAVGRSQNGRSRGTSRASRNRR